MVCAPPLGGPASHSRFRQTARASSCFWRPNRTKPFPQLRHVATAGRASSARSEVLDAPALFLPASQPPSPPSCAPPARSSQTPQLAPPCSTGQRGELLTEFRRVRRFSFGAIVVRNCTVAMKRVDFKYTAWYAGHDHSSQASKES